MNLASAFQSAASGYVAGEQINADLQAKRDESALRQQQLAASKFQLSSQMQAQQQEQDFMKQRQAVIQDYDKTLQQSQVDSGAAPDQAAEAATTKEVQMYSKLSQAAPTLAISEQYQKLADAAQGKLATQRKQNLEVQEKRTKDVAAFAGTVLNGSTDAQTAFTWVKDHVGLQEALSIPTDPAKAKSYWTAKQTQGLSASEQVTNQIQVGKAAQEEKDKLMFHKDAEEDKALQRQALALQREQLKQSRDEALAIRKETLAAGGAIAQRNTVAAVNYANEAARGLDLVSTMGATQTASTFGHLQSPDTILKSLERTGTNKLAPETQQIYQTATKGLGLELAQLATAGSGRAPVKGLIDEMGQMVEARPGDTEYEVMFKLANAADFAKTRLEAVPKSSNPDIQAIREKAEASLNRYPHPVEIIKQAQAKGIKLGQIKDATTMRQKLEKLFPSDEASAAPADVQSLLEKYK